MSGRGSGPVTGTEAAGEGEGGEWKGREARLHGPAGAGTGSQTLKQSQDRRGSGVPGYSVTYPRWPPASLGAGIHPGRGRGVAAAGKSHRIENTVGISKPSGAPSGQRGPEGRAASSAKADSRGRSMGSEVTTSCGDGRTCPPGQWWRARASSGQTDL